MPNNQQPQGVTKHVNNPAANEAGKYVVDFKMPEDMGIATASHLALIIDDAAPRTDIDLIFDPALLRTRMDSMHIEVVSGIATNLNIYTLQKPEHLDDYTTAPKRTLAITADKTELFTAKKLGDVIVFDGANIDRVLMLTAPDNGAGLPPPMKNGSQGTGEGTT